MNALKEAFKLIVFGNIWIAFGAALLSFQTAYQLNLSLNYNYFFFVFFATLCSYSLQRFTRHKEIKSTSSVRQNWLVTNQTVVLFLTIGSGLAAICYAFLSLSVNQLYYLIPLGLISLLYSIKFLNLGNESKGLRDVAFVKVFLIAISWAIISGPLVVLSDPNFDLSSSHLWILTLERFFFILAITIPFDVRDLPFDSIKQKTIPQLIGVDKSVAVSIFLLFVCISLLYSNPIMGNQVFFGGLISYLTTIMIILNTSKDKPELFYSGLIDGTIILQCCLIVTSGFLL